MKHFLLTLALLLHFTLGAQVTVSLTNYATGFNKPVYLTHCGDHRKFVVEQPGRIKVIDSLGNVLPTNFINLTARVYDTGNEQGLLGLAFHPDYANNGYFYVNYTDNNQNTQISRFSVSANDPNVADPNSEVMILNITQPYSNHNGGCIQFGPDGYLYIGMGDGGSGGDPGNRAQNRTNNLGKMLKIDIDNGTPYGIPPTNPFVNDPTTNDEIWAIGLRNPWRFSFDRQTHDLWIGDVGQNNWEEIDNQPAASTGGENYGWRCYEGINHVYNNAGCGPAANYVAPVWEYSHAGLACASVSGGYVYRGTMQPRLDGYYFYAEYCDGRLWALRNNNGTWANNLAGTFGAYNLVSFGEDVDGELFVMGHNTGIIYRLQDYCNVNPAAVPTINQNGATLTSSTATAYQWLLDGAPIPGATSQIYTAVASGDYTVQITNANGCTAVSDSVNVVIIGIEQVAPHGLSYTVSPNPFSDQIQLQIVSAHPTPATITLYTPLGQALRSQQADLFNTSEFVSFPVPELPAGIYVLEVRTKEGVSVQRVVKN